MCKVRERAHLQVGNSFPPSQPLLSQDLVVLTLCPGLNLEPAAWQTLCHLGKELARPKTQSNNLGSWSPAI